MSIIDKLKQTKLYEYYHFHAKYFKTRNDEKIIINKDVDCKALYDDEYVHFFGYYDKPCVYNGKVLSHRLNKDNFDYSQTVDILVDNKKVSESRAWNFQQGSMSSWIDDKHIIHNDFDGKKFISKIINIEDLSTRIIDYPIYSLSKNKEFALSLNFSRLAKLRKDYGYYNLPYDVLPNNNEDGIYYVDIKNNKYHLWLTLKDIIGFKTRANMENAEHKVNHIDISPNDDKAIFLHRWFKDGKKYTRLLCVNIKTKELSLLADDDMVSHMYWYGYDKVFGFLRGNNKQNGYFFIDMNGMQEQFYNDLLVDDGHPTVLNKRYIITDTYPDYTCKEKLLLIDLEKKEVTILGEFYSYKKYQNDKRCDLHPRIDNEGNSLTIDSVCEGKRNIFHLDLNKIIEQ